MSPCWQRRSAQGSRQRREALAYALAFGRDIDDETVDRFVGMYVNELTCDVGDEGRLAVASC